MKSKLLVLTGSFPALNSICLFPLITGSMNNILPSYKNKTLFKFQCSAGYQILFTTSLCQHSSVTVPKPIQSYFLKFSLNSNMIVVDNFTEMPSCFTLRAHFLRDQSTLQSFKTFQFLTISILLAHLPFTATFPSDHSLIVKENRFHCIQKGYSSFLI